MIDEITNNEKVTAEVLAYCCNKFEAPKGVSTEFPLSDECYVQRWEKYILNARKTGVIEELRKHLVQLQFPIELGISLTEPYRNATLKGKVDPKLPQHFKLNEPGSISLELFQSVAGKIPVITITNEEDFENLVRALYFKNEPKKVPSSMGALMINGINNWSRLNSLKHQWLRDNPFGSWIKEFEQNVLPKRDLYQDKVILLSEKYYSGVSAGSIGLKEEKWKEYSWKIRLEHECSHFFTLRYFGHMANNMHDEMAADYMGISSVLGTFRSSWFLTFIGLENYPKYRKGARLQNYLGDSPLSPEAFDVLKTLVYRAATNLENFDLMIGPDHSVEDKTYRLMSVCLTGLLNMAQDDGASRLMENYDRLVREFVFKHSEKTT